MRKLIWVISVLWVFLFAFGGCKKDPVLAPAITGSEIKSISGSAQKGPFAMGTSITFYELNQKYGQTGKSFNTQITDNSGTFQLNNISLISNYVQIRADGFYFNEICGSYSSSQITLNCIADIQASIPVNINLLTHLEKPRVEYLLAQGLPFDSAKTQAQTEILDIFNISLANIQNSENLDISQAGEGNAALLAVSSILQGFRTESELSTLLAVISNDIKTDGVLNDASSKSSLIDQALLLDTISIRSNISDFYSSQGITASIPYFEKFITQFIINSNFTRTNSVFSFPSLGFYGENILNKNQLTYSSGQKSFAGKGGKCSFLKIRLHVISGNPWSYSYNISINVTNYDNSQKEQFFTVIDPSAAFDAYFIFQSGTYLVEYFETNSSTPTFSKTITVN